MSINTPFNVTLTEDPKHFQISLSQNQKFIITLILEGLTNYDK